MKMVVRLNTQKDAFVMLLKKKEYNISQAIERCENIFNKAMYLIAPAGADITPLMDFPWRPNGIFFYKQEYELLKIGDKIKRDLKFIREVGQ